MSEEQKTPDVYKTSKTTWYLIAFMVVILIIIIYMMTRKKKEGDGVTAESGIPAGPPAVKV
jgi:preprotein translocase subunit SecG